MTFAFRLHPVRDADLIYAILCSAAPQDRSDYIRALLRLALFGKENEE